MFCVAFSILFLSITSDHAYALTLYRPYQDGSFTLYGNVVACSDSTSVNYEQVLTYTVNLLDGNPYPLVGKYYLFSGGFKTVSIANSSKGFPGQATINLEYFVEINGNRYYQQSFDNILFKGVNTNTIVFGVVARGTVSPHFGGSLWSSNFVIPVVDVSYSFGIFSLTDDEVSSVTGNDGVQNEIKKGNDLQKEQNETSKGILGKITEFFASFFENLKGLFVPEDGYFSDFFTRLNDFFSEKLGMLYAPIDMFITFLNTIKDASSTESGITFPELAWDGTVIIPETRFSFSTITKDFPDLQEKIYFVTDVILVGAVLWLLQVKLKEVLEN